MVTVFLVGTINKSFATQSVQLTWTTPDQNIVAYHVFYGTKSGAYTNFPVTFSDPDDAIISGLQEGVKYYFAVSVTDASGNNSPLSAEANYTVPIPQPVFLHQQIYTDGNGQVLGIDISATGSVSYNWELDYSTDLLNWNFYEAGSGPFGDILIDMVNDPFVGGSPQAFFRLKN